MINAAEDTNIERKIRILILPIKSQCFIRIIKHLSPLFVIHLKIKDHYATSIFYCTIFGSRMIQSKRLGPESVQSDSSEPQLTQKHKCILKIVII